MCQKCVIFDTFCEHDYVPFYFYLEIIAKMAENALFRFIGKVLIFGTGTAKIGTYSQWMPPKVVKEVKNGQKWPKMAIFGHFWRFLAPYRVVPPG